MLKELFEYLSTEAPPLAKQFKLLQQSIAIKQRHDRCKPHWQSHLENCHRAIQEELTTVRPKHVLIFGSGHLLETPLEIFCEVEKLSLVDFVFPNSVRKKAGRDGRIQLIEMDLTGLLAQLKNLEGPLPLPKSIVLEETPDLVISANIASQLPIHPISYLTDSSKPFAGRYSEEQLTELAKNLILNHIDLLKRFKRALLISDYQKIITNHQTHSTEVLSTLMRIPFFPLQVWDWDLIPLGEIDKHTSVTLKVMVTRFP